MRPIYFDYNATTPILPEVRAAMLPFLDENFGNPSSGHAWGIRARDSVAIARRQVGELIGAAPEQVVFTSCATESIHTVLYSALTGERNAHLVTTAIEHPATLACAAHLESLGVKVSRVGVSRDGVVSPAAVLESCNERTCLISVMLANNETGVLQPVAEIAAAARQMGIPVHCDAAQAVGKLPVDVQRLGVDYLSIAGHKFYAPKGIGALYVANGRPLRPLLRGGGQEWGLRSGTENVPHISALGAASAIAAVDLEDEVRRQLELGREFLAGLKSLGGDFLLHGDNAQRLPQTMFVGFCGLRAMDLLSGLVGYDVAVSAGAACHGAETTLSHVLQAMGTPTEYAEGTLRFSWGRETTSADVYEVVERLGRVLNDLGWC